MEVRDQIWELAYGGRTLHPPGDKYIRDWDSMAPHSKDWRVSYVVCQQNLSDREIYDMSVEGASDEKPMVWNSTRLNLFGNYMGCRDCQLLGPVLAIPRLVPAIYKQLLDEGLPIAWKTTTFAFTYSGDLQHFIQSQYTSLGLIQYLSFLQYPARLSYSYHQKPSP